MNTGFIITFLAFLLLCVNDLSGQTPTRGPSRTNEGIPQELLAQGKTAFVKERGAHFRRWNTVNLVTNRLGDRSTVRAVTNSYTELATGLSYRDRDGTWQDSDPEVSLAADGGAEARKIPHKVWFAPDIRTVGAVRLTMPGGQTMSSTVRRLDKRAFPFFLNTDGQFWLDNRRFYNGNSIEPTHAPIHFTGEVQLGDGPATPGATVFTTELSADTSFQAYLVFRPDIGDPEKNIWVTLGRVDWSWKARAARGPTWNITEDLCPPPQFHSYDSFPQWENVYTNPFGGQ